MIKILIVEDDKAINQLISTNLEIKGYKAFSVYDGVEAADILDEKHFDLILLDIMLPEVDGFELMAYIRPLEIPVIFISARDDIKSKVKGLNLGAEDYIVKPFDVIELLARVEVVLRRYNKSEEKITIDDVFIDFEARVVSRAAKRINLTAKEYGLLELFVRNQNVALFREVLYNNVWGGDYDGDSRTVDLHVQRLRKKLKWEDKIKAVYKVGYRLEV